MDTGEQYACRRIKGEDIPAIIDLVDMCDLDSDYIPYIGFVVYSQDNLLLGYTGATVTRGHTAEVDVLAVHPLYQNKQIGKLLLYNLLSYLKKNKVENLTAITEFDNVHSRKVFTQLGIEMTLVMELNSSTDTLLERVIHDSKAST
jgi:N-acetylglutamate synthase-like GNAT family acetyltransferase